MFSCLLSDTRTNKNTSSLTLNRVGFFQIGMVGGGRPPSAICLNGPTDLKFSM